MAGPVSGGAGGDAPVLHLTGPVRVDADDVRGQAWVHGGSVTFERPDLPAGTDVVTVDGWVLPGLVDAHCHIGLDAHGAVDRETTERQALTDRDAGTLLARDAGSPADTRWLDDRPDLPRVVRAGRHVARPRRYIRNYAAEVEPDALVAEVRHQARRGDGWVKLVGDWIDRDLGDLAPLWPADVVAAAIDAAHTEGARVTAHCFSEDALPDLLAAGIDGIEHGTGFGPATVAAAADQRVAVVPTLVNIATFPQLAARGEDKFPRWAAHMRALHARRLQNVRDLHEAGVPLFVGTDAGGSLPHGLVAQEVAELVGAGLPPLVAVGAGSWAARRWLGRDGLAEGASADLVVHDADPVTEPGVLAHPRAVVLRGRLVRGGGAEPPDPRGPAVVAH
ncbi:amidohydrolase family protein [Aquipuribacter sp. SD81]|uniref:amidohydrolase family protein n=1 Tax=Aquipuribacter sp. SD81 TaxID=3127703 RepID=UPI003017CAF8